MTVCVYAIAGVRARPLRTRGLLKERLTIVKAGRVGAIVGHVRRVPGPRPASIAAYHDVVQRLWSELPSMLPLRYGTVSEEDVLFDLLRSRASVFADALREVRGRAQMTVRLVDQARQSDPPVQRAAGSRPGTTFLHARAAQARRERHVAPFDPLRPSVARWIRSERIERRGGIATLYHLVPRASAGRYRRALAAASRSSGTPVVVSGPFAPYAFAADLTW